MGPLRRLALRLTAAGALAAAAAPLSGCELGGNGTHADDVSVSSRADGGACPPSGELRTARAAGAACSVSGDCAEHCCACSSGTGGFAAAACINGLCAAKADSCQKAEENRPALCP